MPRAACTGIIEKSAVAGGNNSSACSKASPSPSGNNSAASDSSALLADLPEWLNLQNVLLAGLAFYVLKKL
jgi:hypothetical protein